MLSLFIIILLSISPDGYLRLAILILLIFDTQKVYLLLIILVFLMSLRGNPELEAILTAVARATNYSTNAHVPRQAIRARFRRSRRGKIRTKLRKLASRGFVACHPTRGGTTWQLTKSGLNLLRKTTYLIE